MNDVHSLKFKLLFIGSSLIMAVVGLITAAFLLGPFMFIAGESGNKFLENCVEISMIIIIALLSFIFQPLKMICKGTQLTWRRKLVHALCSLAFLLIYYLTYSG